MDSWILANGLYESILLAVRLMNPLNAVIFYPGHLEIERAMLILGV